MTFLSDLERWTARALANAPRSKLPENIQRLLRGEDTVRLGPVNALGLPPEELEARPGDPEGTGIGGEYIMESGLGIARPVDEASVFRVYVSAALAATWSGAPPAWGWIDEHAQGVMSPSAFACATATGPTWTGAETLGSAGDYQSRASSSAISAWANDPDRQPHRHTGLLRLAAQAFGPHAKITELRPDSWPGWNPVYYGILRRDTGATLEYWLTYAGPEGCRVIKLIWGATVRCLVDGIRAGTWSAEQNTQAEAWILRTLERPEAGSGDELLNADAMAPAHDDGWGPFANGWHYSPQYYGTASETETECVMLAVRGAKEGGYYNYLETNRCTLMVDLAAGSAALIQGGAGSVSVASPNYLFKESPTDGLFRQYDPANPADPGAGDIYVVYWPSGPEWIATLGYEEEWMEAFEDFTSYVHGVGKCGPGTASRSSSRNLAGTAWNCGYNLPGSSGVTLQSGKIISETGTVTIAEDNSEDGYFTSGGGLGPADGYNPGSIGTADGNNLPSMTSCGDPLSKDSDPPICNGRSTVGLGTIDFTLVRTQRGAGGGVSAALIIHADPTLVTTVVQEYYPLAANDLRRWSLHRGDFVVSLSVASSNEPSNGGCQGGGQISFANGVWDGSLIDGETWYGPRSSEARYNLNPADVIGGEGDKKAKSGYFHWAYDDFDENSTNPGGETNRTTVAKCHTPGGPVDLLGYSSADQVTGEGWDLWLPYCSPGSIPVTGPIAGPTARISYAGDLIHQEAAGKELKSPDGYDESAVSEASVALFMGFE